MKLGSGNIALRIVGGEILRGVSFLSSGLLVFVEVTMSVYVINTY
jgi:hypothetical protein